MSNSVSLILDSSDEEDSLPDYSQDNQLVEFGDPNRQNNKNTSSGDPNLTGELLNIVSNIFWFPCNFLNFTLETFDLT